MAVAGPGGAWRNPEKACYQSLAAGKLFARGTNNDHQPEEELSL